MAAVAEQTDSRGRGGRVLFQVPFSSPMGDAELARLAHLLDMTTSMAPKMNPDPADPGVARLDRFTGLYLERGEGEGQWILEARTWGRPPSAAVRRWQVRAAQAARALDPSVTVPPAPDGSAPSRSA
ncbi:MAG TPA: hypothetical protein VKV27_06595 [Solirubrobacteraceae bacterium]|nr:hypothetical protein [Solirubrobacteraceae bacterium]